MYVAPRTERTWLQSEQRRLHTRSENQSGYIFCKLWGLITDPRNLRVALARVARNRGRRTAGVDGITVRMVFEEGVDAFIDDVRGELRSGTFHPSPVRRVLIPKPGQPGKHRPLGIPTVKDRVVQAAMKNILEPIFEADFYPTSYGFRPGKSVHAALEHLRMLLRPREAGPEAQRRLPYQWAVEGDIRGCFDNIDHHALMVRVRQRVGDPKVSRLVLAFLKAGIMSEAQFLRTEAGTPQGGILSPLLANIALQAIDERYARHVRPSPTVRTKRVDATSTKRRATANRWNDRRRGLDVLMPVRYADDFIILVSVKPGPGQDDRGRERALHEKAELAAFLREKWRLELSEAKSLVTPVTRPLRFLGHHVRVRKHPVHGRLVSAFIIPRDKSHGLRERIKDLFRARTIRSTLGDRLRRLNPMLRGWANFYRHAWGAKRVFSSLDSYVWWTILRWLRKKHDRAAMDHLARRYGWSKPGGRAIRWRDDGVAPFAMARVRVQRFKLGWITPPHFARSFVESPVHNERCTPGSEGGARKPAGESR
jgi:RNA-directed DNA polymerase